MTGSLAAVAAQRVLPVVTIEDAGAARELGAALQAAGANTVEITFRSAAAAEAITVFADQGFIVGAGTVRSREHAEQARRRARRSLSRPGLTGTSSSAAPTSA